jgi:excinuclease ABC subunit A
VVVIEHNLDVIKTADRIIDLGPEGGGEGGALVAQGTPEQVAAKTDTSYTGRFLADIVKPAGRRRRTGPRAKVLAAAELRAPQPNGSA